MFTHVFLVMWLEGQTTTDTDGWTHVVFHALQTFAITSLAFLL